jgi:hypothetical protein
LGFRAIEHDWLIDKMTEINEGINEIQILNENKQEAIKEITVDCENRDLKKMIQKFLREQLQAFLIATATTLEESKKISLLTIFGMDKKRKVGGKKRPAVQGEVLDMFDKQKRKVIIVSSLSTDKQLDVAVESPESIYSRQATDVFNSIISMRTNDYPSTIDDTIFPIVGLNTYFRLPAL